MVLWEITVATAYFLGLRRTYRLALKIQRRLLGTRYPKIRGFLLRRTRSAFDIALSVHKKIQQRDIEARRNPGNWMLRWLDRRRPSAQIRPPLPIPPGPPPTSSTHKITTGQPSGTQKQTFTSSKIDSNGRLFATAWTSRPKSFPSIAMMMHPPNTGSMINQFRPYKNLSLEITSRTGLQGVFRKDIEQWMTLG